MLTAVKNYFKLFIVYFKANLSSAMEYRTSFIINTIGMMLNNLIFTMFWVILFSRINLIRGYTLKDVMFIWALGNASFGFASIVFGNGWKLSSVIVDGSLDSYIIQPKNVLLNVLMSKSLIGSWGDFLFGWTLYFSFFGFNLSNLALFTVFVIAGGLVISGFQVTANTLTFYWGNAQAIANLSIETLITFLTYPEGIFNGFIRLLTYTFLPAGFIIFVPFRLFKSFNVKYALVLLVVDILYFLFAQWFFNQGLKKYESGNLIITKL